MKIDTVLSLFSMTPYFLIDGHLTDIPYNLISGVENYKILKGTFFVQSPSSDFILKHTCLYKYDTNDNLMHIAYRCDNKNFTGVDYSLDILKRNKKQYKTKERYSLFERVSDNKNTAMNIEKNEAVIDGDYYSYRNNNEYTYSEIIKCRLLTSEEVRKLQLLE